MRIKKLWDHEDFLKVPVTLWSPNCHDFVTGVKKMTAKAAKTVKYGSSVDGISTAEPEQYSKRFLAFMADAIEGE